MLDIAGASGRGLLVRRSGGLALIGLSAAGEGTLMTAWGLTEEGLPSGSFGSGGSTVIPTVAGYDTSGMSAATTDAQGGLLLAGGQGNTRDNKVNPTPRPAIVDLQAGGAINRSFGEAGFALGPPGSGFAALSVDSEGRAARGRIDRRTAANRRLFARRALR